MPPIIVHQIEVIFALITSSTWERKKLWSQICLIMMQRWKVLVEKIAYCQCITTTKDIKILTSGACSWPSLKPFPFARIISPKAVTVAYIKGHLQVPSSDVRYLTSAFSAPFKRIRTTPKMPDPKIFVRIKKNRPFRCIFCLRFLICHIFICIRHQKIHQKYWFFSPDRWIPHGEDVRCCRLLQSLRSISKPTSLTFFDHECEKVWLTSLLRKFFFFFGNGSFSHRSYKEISPLFQSTASHQMAVS